MRSRCVVTERLFHTAAEIALGFNLLSEPSHSLTIHAAAARQVRRRRPLDPTYVEGTIASKRAAGTSIKDGPSVHSSAASTAWAG